MKDKPRLCPGCQRWRRIGHTKKWCISCRRRYHRKCSAAGGLVKIKKAPKVAKPVKLPKLPKVKEWVHGTYGDRDKLLTGMGYNSYSDYLTSDLWNRIRRQCWAAHGRACKICSQVAEVSHHITYETSVLLGSDTYKIVPLCKTCHRLVEFRDDGSKRSLIEAQIIYGRLRAKKV